MRTIGTSACPPYRLAVVIGGMSAEYNLKMVKLASTKYLDTLPTSGNEYGRAFRDLELEEKILEIAQNLGIGAQFGYVTCEPLRTSSMIPSLACVVGAMLFKSG